MDFVRTPALIALLVLVAGCGSSGDDKTTASQSQTATTPPASGTTTTAPSTRGAKGRLSATEYKQMVAAYAILKKVAIADPGKDITAAMRATGKACKKITSNTALMAAVRDDCNQTLRFLVAAQALVTRRSECTKAAQAGDVSCFADLFRTLGRSVRLESARAEATNRELRRRAITGDCFAAIGTLPKERAATRAVVHDALGAAHALEARNQDAFVRAASKLTTHLTDVGASGGAAKTASQLKACR